MFVTNNSTLSRKNYVKKFEKLGIHASEKDIFSSSFATAVYLRNILNFPKDKRVFVIGESGIVDELKEVGIETCGASVSYLFYLVANLCPVYSLTLVSRMDINWAF